MRVGLKLVLDCPPDAAWRALRSPSVFADVSYPLLEFQPLGDGINDAGFPEEWDEGSHPVRARALFSILDAGTQDIDITLSERRGVRIFEDNGGPLSGPLAIVTRWRHRMAVSAGSTTGTTLFRDRLEFSAGLLTPVVWAGLWLFWQWRGRALSRLAPGFANRFATEG